jgi:hypothetical protein
MEYFTWELILRSKCILDGWKLWSLVSLNWKVKLVLTWEEGFVDKLVIRKGIRKWD